MLIEAEKIRAICRRTNNIGPHAEYMGGMTKYGTKKGFLTGESEEYLSQAAEIAACILEVNYGETIGSVLDSSHERKLDIIKSAKEKVKAKFKSTTECGR